MYEVICECGSNEFITEPKGHTFSFDDLNRINSVYVCPKCKENIFRIRFTFNNKLNI